MMTPSTGTRPSDGQPCQPCEARSSPVPLLRFRILAGAPRLSDPGTGTHCRRRAERHVSRLSLGARRPGTVSTILFWDWALAASRSRLRMLQPAASLIRGLQHRNMDELITEEDRFSLARRSRSSSGRALQSGGGWTHQCAAGGIEGRFKPGTSQRTDLSGVSVSSLRPGP